MGTRSQKQLITQPVLGNHRETIM